MRGFGLFIDRPGTAGLAPPPASDYPLDDSGNIPLDDSGNKPISG